MTNPTGYETIARFNGGEVLANARRVIVLGTPIDGEDANGDSLHNCDAMGCGQSHVVAIVDRPAPAPTSPGLDLEEIERAERAMTPGPWEAKIYTTHVAGTSQETQWHEAISDGGAVVCETECSAFEDESAIGAVNIAGIVALRNAAPALIAEVRTLRANSDVACAELERVHAELERSVDHGNAALVAERNALADTLARAVWPDRQARLALPIVVGNAVDRLQRAAADLAASRAEVRELRAKLAEAKRLGLEACALANSYADDAREYGGDTAAADRIAAALEAL